MSDCFKKQVSISGHSTVRKWTLLLWEHDGETGQAIIRVGQQGEGAAVFGEDVTNEKQSKPLTLGFGGIKRGKDMLGDFRRDALAVVGDDERPTPLPLPTREGSRMFCDLDGNKSFPFGWDRNDAFDGVLDDVDQCLLEEGRVEMHRDSLISEVKSQTDVVGLAESVEEGVAGFHLLAQVAERELRFGHFHHVGKACDKLSHLLGAFPTGFEGFLCCAVGYFSLDEV